VAINPYGVFKGKIMNIRPADTDDKTPHYEVHIKGNNEDYRIAINIASREWPSEVLYLVGEDFHSEQLDMLPTLSEGFKRIHDRHDELAIDYIRGGLFAPSKMIDLPASAAGANNELNEKVNKYFLEAKEKGAMVYAFGEKYEHEKRGDEYFGFSPNRGIHDLHMNQGNHTEYQKDDGIWQDGAVLIHFEAENRWVGMFIAFQSQSWSTDDRGRVERPVNRCNHKTVREYIATPH